MSEEKFRSRCKKKAFMHLFFLVTWTPLIWVMSGDFIESFIINWKYKSLFMWGCGSTTAILNGYLFIINSWKSRSNISNDDVFHEVFGWSTYEYEEPGENNE